MNDPVTMRRQLRAELKRLRIERDLTQRFVADELDWSPSKIIRIEKGSVAIGVTDVQALLRLYGVEDRDVTTNLVNMARGSKRLPYNEFKNQFPADTMRFFSYESTANIRRQMEPLVVAGLLQTEEYAQHLLTALGTSADRIDTIWGLRSERQEQLLEREDPPEMFFILDEAAVRRVVGSAGVMERQRARLIELNAYPRVSVQILPFEAGAHFGQAGPFTYLEFPDDEDPNVLFVESPLGDTVLRDEDELTARYLDAFFALEKQAAPAADLEKILGRLA